MRASPGTALLEFALAWPVALLLVLVAVQVALWGVASYAARSAALAGARAGSAADAGTATAAGVAAQVLRSSLFSAEVVVSCVTEPRPGEVRVCAIDVGQVVEVDVDGAAPLLVPLPGSTALPIGARAVLQRESFMR